MRKRIPVESIQKMLNSQVRIADMADRYGVSLGAIYNIINKNKLKPIFSDRTRIDIPCYFGNKEYPLDRWVRGIIVTDNIFHMTERETHSSRSVDGR